MALTKISTGMLKQDAASSDLNIDAGTLYIDVSNNRVGIANTSPSQALDVTGNVVISGTATATTFVGSGASLTSIPNSALTNSSITINSTATSLGGSITLGTDDVAEGSTNLYYTNARADARIAAASTDDLSEGSSNLYYTDARADARVALVVDSAPSTLNTLNELAAALGDDANFSTTVTNSIAAKLPLAGGTMTGPLVVDTDTEHQIKIDASSASGASMHLNTAGGYAYTVYQNSDRVWRIGAYGGSSFTIRDHTGNTNPLVINSSGNVGIGTDSPTSKLHIIGNQFNTGQIRANTGTAANPNFTIDGGAGMFKPTSNVVGFSTNSTERLRIASGNPYMFLGHTGHSWTTFHAVAQIGRTGAVATYDSGANQQTIVANNTYYGSGGYTSIEGTSAASYMNVNQGHISFFTAPTIAAGSVQTFTQRFQIHRDGNIGIGTAAPVSTLDLTNTSDTAERAIRIENNSARLYVGVEGSSGNRFVGSAINNGFIGTTTDDGLELATANAVRAVITNTGNVGIGTSSPATTLDVEGNITLSGSNGKIYLPQTPNNFNWIGDPIEQTGIVIIPTNDGTSERITFAVDNSECMRITNTGNVGIGTSNPTVKMHIVDSDGEGLRLENATAAPTNSVSNAPHLEFFGRGWDSNYGSKAIKARIEHTAAYGDYGFGATQGALVFSVQGAGGINSAPDTMQEGMRLAAGSDTYNFPRLGIGDTDPDGPLHVTSTGHASIFEGTGGNVSLKLLRSDASGAVDFADIQFANSTGIAARINSRGEGSASGNLTFQTRNTSGTLAERVRIDSSGNVGIGTTNPDCELSVDGTISSGTTTKPTHATYDSNGNMRSFEHHFTVSKSPVGAGTAVNYTLVDISGLANFHQASFVVEYGTRLQTVSDSTTGTVVRTYGVNRFNSGNINLTETNAIAGSSNSLTHALVTVEVVSNTQYRLRVEFSSTLGTSSFVSGVIRGYGVSDYFPTISFSKGMAGS